MFPGTLDPRIAYTRASTGTYFDSTGTMQTAAINAPRWDYDPTTLQLRGLLMEEGRTNLILNSATLVTQSVTTTATAYTLSFYGTGTVTKSGAATGALAGTGAAQRVTQTFTPTAGSLTLTVTGSVTNGQIEAGPFATSWIPTTGATATRAIDIATMPLGSWYNASTGTFTSEHIYQGFPTLLTRTIELSDGGASNISYMAPVAASTRHDLATVIATVSSTSVTVAGAPVANVVSKSTMAYGTNRFLCVNNGVGPLAINSATGGFPPLVSLMHLANSANGTRPQSLWFRGILYWGRQLTNAEITAVTT